jgi:hypothetical protein
MRLFWCLALINVNRRRSTVCG